MATVTFIDKKMSMKGGKMVSPLFGAYVIISESMVPHINVYDAVVTIRVNEKQIQVDDIITFLSKEIETAGTPITHRVIGIVHDPNNQSKIIGYRTKGDHNNTADFALIAPNEVIGKVFLRIPMIGYLQLIMTKPIGWLLVIVIPCLLIIGTDIFKLFKNAKLRKLDDDTADKQSDTIISADNVRFNDELYHRLESGTNFMYNQENHISTEQKDLFPVNSNMIDFSNSIISQSNINQSLSSSDVENQSIEDDII